MKDEPERWVSDSSVLRHPATELASFREVLDPVAALRFWYDTVNYEQRTAQPGDLKLDRMRQLLARLGDPHERLRILHVAGTKGKGSTAAMLASILQQAGYRTGLFTSPHLTAVSERFQVAGRAITEAELTALLNEIRAAVAGVPDITFFEICTAVGFLHFVRRRVDVAILEVGLGGRFDSTNVCTPDVALITSISFDHTKQLGHTLASIAFEKAGIVKAGRPTISGVVVPEARAVIEDICRQRRSPLTQLERDVHFDYLPGRVEPAGVVPPRLQVTTRRGTWADLELNLLGRHQAANAALAVAAIETLQGRGWPIRAAAVRAGLARVHWPARLEILRRRPLVVVDCAHNVASAEAATRTLLESFPPARRILVFASSNDKDVAGMARVLAPHFAAVVATRFTANTRAIAPEQLVATFAQHGLPVTLAATPADAWEAAQRLAGPDDLVCVLGSVFLAGEMRALLTAA